MNGTQTLDRFRENGKPIWFICRECPFILVTMNPDKDIEIMTSHVLQTGHMFDYYIAPTLKAEEGGL